MSSGTVIAIYTTSIHSQPTQPQHSVRVIPGLGLEGDRHFGPAGTAGKRKVAGRDITLIEIEALQALESDHDLRLTAAEARRNIVTQGVSLNELVGKEFQVGPVRLRGVRLCEPCDHLGELTDPRVVPALVHRGGLRADILNEGIVSVGDLVIINPA